MKLLCPLIFVTAVLPNARAHYFFPHFIANGNFTDYFEYVREDTQNYMPFKNGYDSTDLRCNVGSEQYANKTGVYKVHAGDEIGFGTDFNVEIQHPGPLQVYLSKAPGDVREYDGSGDWFKIYELGPSAFSSDGIEWGVTGIGNFTFTLPEETPAGQYLVRIEHIAVHGAGEFGGAELYFNCAQIEVESDSADTPGPLVKIPGVYTGYEPGILFYMYRPWIVNYTMPGPVPWPNALDANITASGVSIAPTTTPWTLPAITNEAGTSTGASSVLTPVSYLSTTPIPSNASTSERIASAASITLADVTTKPVALATSSIDSSHNSSVVSRPGRCGIQYTVTSTVSVTGKI